MAKKDAINVQGTEITVVSDKGNDYISLTDMAGYRDEMEARVVVSNWMSTYYTIEFLAVWEQVNNPDFNRMGYHTVRNTPGRLVVTPKRWVEMTGAIGIFSKAGRYGGGIFAHKDIAFEFGTWLSAEFKYFLIRDFQRLKEEEQSAKSLEWNLQRTLSKINYRIHTDAIKEHIVPAAVTKEQVAQVYASEADLLNVALFGKTPRRPETNSDFCLEPRLLSADPGKRLIFGLGFKDKQRLFAKWHPVDRCFGNRKRQRISSGTSSQPRFILPFGGFSTRRRTPNITAEQTCFTNT